MRLTDLLSSDPVTLAGGPPAAGIDIAGLTADSRAVSPGYLFAAIPGSRADGRAFIADAVAKGAVAVLAPPGEDVRNRTPDHVCLVVDEDPRRRLAILASRFYGAQPRVTVAVTGTNGKTSVAWFVRQIWVKLGFSAASMGTLGVTADGVEPGPSLTTPDPVSLHKTLAALAARGVDHLAMEASSHGLEQSRLDGVRFGAAAFTNLTRDHLDYHKTMDAYRTAKLRLFTDLLPEGAGAVLNADAGDFAAFDAAARRRGLRVMSYGKAGRDLTITGLSPRADGQTLSFSAFGKDHAVDLALPGAFQAGNVLCAAGLAIATGADPDAVISTLPSLGGVRGRLERVAAHPNGAPIYVDYAHTPDALDNAIASLRPHVRKNLVVVFGCGGDRDRGKRPLMGKIAEDLADTAIVTDDNPRTEDAATIRREILDACPSAQEIGDCAEAIYAGIAALGPDDALLIAGKGHESGQIVGTQVRPFDDADTARAVVAALAGRAS